MVLVFDIDGTLLDNSKRIHLIDGTVMPKEWDKYYSEEMAAQDVPVRGAQAAVANLIRTLEKSPAKPYYCVLTGRMVKSAEFTKKQIEKFYPELHALMDGWHFRPDDDFRPAPEYKGEAMRKIMQTPGLYGTLDSLHDFVVFEDDTRVHETFKDLGVVVHYPPACWEGFK